MGATLFCKFGPLKGKTFTIEDEAVIGRTPACEIVLAHKSISGRHARIFRNRGQQRYMIEDLSSLNGTLIDGVRINEAEPLEHLHMVNFGGVLDFFFRDPEAERERGQRFLDRDPIERKTSEEPPAPSPPKNTKGDTHSGPEPVPLPSLFKKAERASSGQARPDGAEVEGNTHSGPEPVPLPSLFGQGERAPGEQARPVGAEVEGDTHSGPEPVPLPSLFGKQERGQTESQQEGAPKQDPLKRTLNEALPIGLPALFAPKHEGSAEESTPRKPAPLLHELVVWLPKGEQRIFDLKEGENLIGRTKRASINIPNEEISRKHAVITVQKETIRIKDLGSTNHTYIDHREIKSEENIQPHQAIYFGKLRAMIVLKTAPIGEKGSQK